MQKDWWNKYMYIPFKEKGRDESGADCLGLMRIILKNECGIILPSYDDLYENTIHKESVSGAIDNVQKELFKTVVAPMPFDIAILRFCGLPMHIGIVTKKNFMIHCSKDIGVCHEKYTGMRWKDKIIGFVRYDGKPDTDLCNGQALQ